MRTLLPALAFAALSALPGCFGPREPVPPFELAGPYREPNDACRLVRSVTYTDRFDDIRGDLVACPQTMPRLDLFAADVNGIAVDRVAGFVLYSVPPP